MHTTIESRDAKFGKLEVHITFDSDNNILSEVFTFASLASVLRVPLSTLEGRYARSNAKIRKIDLYSGAGRPQRGFPLSMLEEIITVLTTPGAKCSPPGGETTPSPNGRAPLVPVTFNGAHYFTVQALADHYGVSTTTVRNKLTRAGLIHRMVPVDTSANGGRPRKGFAQAHLGLVHLAMEGGHVFTSDEGTRLATLSGQGATAQRAMDSQVGPADYVPFRRAVAVRPAAPHAQVRTGGTDPRAELEAFAREIDAQISRGATHVDTDSMPELPQLALAKLPPPTAMSENGVEYIQFATAQEWQARLGALIHKYVVDKVRRDQTYFSNDVTTLNGQGLTLGLATDLVTFSEAVTLGRTQRLERLQPYVDFITEFVEQHFHDERKGADKPTVEEIHAFTRMADATPLPDSAWVGTHAALVARFRLGPALKAAIANLEDLQDSPLHRKHYAVFMDILAQAQQRILAEHGVDASGEFVGAD